MTTPDLLNLKHLRVVDVADEGDWYRVRALGTADPPCCPRCGGRLYGHGAQLQKVMDTPMHGKRVMLEVTRRRFRCPACKATLFEPIPDLHERRQMTVRLVAYIERHCLKQTFAALHREIGVDNKTIRLVFDDYKARLEATIRFETPRVLGIDEIKVIGQYRAMITNVEHLCLFDMLPTRKKEHLLAYFKALPDKDKVEFATMDLWNVYRDVITSCLPKAQIVADRFHVVRMADFALDTVRKSLRSTLTQKERIKLKDDRELLHLRGHELDEPGKVTIADWFERFPILGKAYRCKEAFHALYEYPDKQQAREAAHAWVAHMPPELASDFRETAGALQRWEEAILRYYDARISNGYTESINNIAKSVNAIGRGYSFDVLRARLLYDSEARKDGRGTIRRKTRVRIEPQRDQGAGAVSVSYFVRTPPTYREVEQIETVEYGPSLPTLVRLLRAGHFA